MRQSPKAVAIALALTFSSPALAAPKARAAAEQRVVDGAYSEKHVESLTKAIHWRRSLDEALAIAKREDKLVFWMHVKGDLDGAT
ncbi:MAG TPA: hypothetical protein VHF22_15815 [Planctomycetota bacterium]|nr:hypothetical protein [Planctomycetota bacterium]